MLEIRGGHLIDLVVQVALLDVGQDEDVPAEPVRVAARHAARRELVHAVVVVVEGEAELLEVVAALHASGGLAHLLDGWQEKTDEDGNDGDHNKKLDQREGGTS